jgi:phosphatidylinositol 4-kinase
MDEERGEGLVSPSPVEDETDSPPPAVVPQQTTRIDPPTRRNIITAAQTTPALPLHVRRHRKPRLSDDPLGQMDADTESTQTSPFQSTPTFSPRPSSHRPKDPSESLLQQYDMPSQIHILRSQFCRNEVKFILALENICNRLLVVPRPARVSALRAELTALNHKLPTEVNRYSDFPS